MTGVQTCALPIFEDVRKEEVHSAEFNYSGGIVSFVEMLNTSKHAIHAPVIHFESQKDSLHAEVAMQYSDSYTESIFCFTNAINNSLGGTHLEGFRAALTRTLNDYLKKDTNLAKKMEAGLSGDDVREGLTCPNVKPMLSQCYDLVMIRSAKMLC